MFIFKNRGLGFLFLLLGFTLVFCLFGIFCFLFVCTSIPSVLISYPGQAALLDGMGSGAGGQVTFSKSVSSAFKLHCIVWIERRNICHLPSGHSGNDSCYRYWQQVCWLKGETLTGPSSLMVLFASFLSLCPSLRGSPGDGCHAPERLAPGEL